MEHKFTGKERDGESGLDYFGARHYGSAIGRFVSADTFNRKLLVNPQDLNLYSYTINNPLRFTDPNGRDWKDIASGIAHGANNFVEHTYAAAIAAAKDPFTVLHGAASAVETAAKAYGTAEGRSGLASQWNSMSQQEKTAVVTEALIAGGLAGGLKAQAQANAASGLSNDALVVRGGVPSAQNIANSAESIAPNGTVQGVSVQSANGATVQELSTGLPQNQIGVATVGDFRSAGGDVVQSPLEGSPNHCDLCGVTPQQASDLFDQMRNPNKPPKPPNQN